MLSQSEIHILSFIKEENTFDCGCCYGDKLSMMEHVNLEHMLIDFLNLAKFS